MFHLTRRTPPVVLLNMGPNHRGIAHQVFRGRGMGFPPLKLGVISPPKCLLMRSPIFFSKGRSVRFWIQILLVLALVRIAIVPSALYANPTGEQVVGGAATFNRPDAATLIVKQQTDRAVINWNSFSIANGELTKFVQPSSSSAVLNRVVTGNPSQIYGTLQGNGQVFLINPGGFLVGAGGQVNAASFMASTRDIGTEEFMGGGTLNFTGNSDASVVNKGKIDASTGDVFLVAQEVKNEGQIMAKDGTVGLVSGTSVTLETVGPGRHYKVRLLDVENSSSSRQSSEASAEIVNEGVIDAANAELLATGNYLSLAIKNTGTIRATGLVQNADGSVTLTGGQGDVLNTGVLAALQRSVDGVEQGGMIDISGKNIRADEGSLITASGQDGGGKIKFESKDTTMLGGRVEATGYSSKSEGGRVEALGTRVGLRSGEINVDGGSKGGTVLVGGDYLGINPNVPNADAVVMLPDAKISANARENGDGGKVILWSEDYTGFFGKISAMGGVEGGNGGFIETSSRNNLQAFGEAQASAPKGISGEWLLDPYNVTITSTGPTSGGSFGGGNPDVFTPIQDSANILNTEINRALDSGTSVTITTGSSYVGSQIGNITVSAPILKSKDAPPDGPPVTLSLLALNDITINADIKSTAGPLYMVFVSDVDKNMGGTFTLGAGVNLLTNAGDISITAVDVALNGTINTLGTQQLPVTITNGGSYAPGTIPEVSFTVPVTNGYVAPGATALMGLRTIDVSAGGRGYTTAPAVTFLGGGGQAASAVANMGIPTTGPSAVTLGSGGSGYVTAPTVTLVGGGATVVATATATVAGGVVTGITINAPGSGYTSLPSVIITGGGGSGAFARINDLTVSSVVIKKPGSDFVSAPTISFQGGGGSGAVATSTAMQVVNLDYASYGVGYAVPPTVTFSGAATGSLGLTTIAGNVGLFPSVSTSSLIPPTTIGIGSGAGTFSVSGAEIGRISTIGSALSGAITIGDRRSGNVTLGQATPVTAVDLGAQNLEIATGGTILDDQLGGATPAPSISGTGLITLSAAGGIGSTGNTVNLGFAKVKTVTEGTTLNLSTLNQFTDSYTRLTQLGITTIGTTSSISVSDGNVTLNVTESGGNTFFAPAGQAFGLTLAQSSLDFLYENSAGDITIGTLGTFGSTVQNVQAATQGVPDVFRDMELRAPNGTINVFGPIFTGGGNLTLASQDLQTRVGLGWGLFGGALNVSGTQPNVNYYGYGAMNTYQSTGADFGGRSPLSAGNNGVAGSISGIGGVLTFEPTSSSATGQKVVMSLGGGTANAYNLSWADTTMMEAPQIRIGGSQTGQILIEDLNQEVFRSTTYTFGQSGTETITYLPRYFENPFFSSVTSPGGIDNNPNNTTGIPHVTGGVVSFVSALGQVQNVSGGDVNLFGLEMTGVDGVYFDGRGGNDDYAAKDQSTANNSLIGVFNSRVGRTVQDETIGSGGNVVAYIPFGFTVDDGALGTRVSSQQAAGSAAIAGGRVVSLAPAAEVQQIDITSTGNAYTAAEIQASGTPSVTINSPVGSGATASSYLRVTSLGIGNLANLYDATVPSVLITGGGGTGATAIASCSIPSMTVGSGGSGYTTAPTVQITGGGGIGATATAVVVGGVVTSINITNPGSGYTTTPTITITGGGGSGAEGLGQYQVNSMTVTSGGSLYSSVPNVALNGVVIDNAQPQVASLTVAGVSISNNGVGYTVAPTVQIAPPLVGAAPTALATVGLGQGDSYTSAPPVSVYGGGIQLGSARTLQSADGVIQSVLPQIVGLGYTSAPIVSIQDPSGKGAGATATAFVNQTGQLTPFNMSSYGEGYTAPPTVTISGPTGSGAVARAEVSGYVKQSNITVSAGGSGYTTVPQVQFSGGGGSGATGEAIVSVDGRITGINVTNPGLGYTSTPTISILGGGGTGASASVTTLVQGVTGIYITDPGSGYVVTDPSQIRVKIAGGGGTGAEASLDQRYSFVDLNKGLTPIALTSRGQGYSLNDEPIVTLTGGGIAQAQARAILDNRPGSSTFGKVTAYEITDPGQGYNSAPSLAVGWGQAFGNFGEYGISTETVDRNVGSGYISLSNLGGARIGGMTINAPIQTGSAQGVLGGDAISGAILLNSGTRIAMNTDGGADGILITGDASIVPRSDSVSSARSGSITLLSGGTIANSDSSSLAKLSGSIGLPVQIGTASGGFANLPGALNATSSVRDSTTVFVGDILIYAPAPGQVDAAQGGRPLDSNHPQAAPRTSNDLKLTGLSAPATVTDDADQTFPSNALVQVEVGALGGNLTLLRFSEAQATATLTGGRVTLITPNLGGELYGDSPTVVITGGGIVPAEASALVKGGVLTGNDPLNPNKLIINNPGSGYVPGSTLNVTFEVSPGQNGSGALATATVDANGNISQVLLSDSGYGYTAPPTVVLPSPPGQAQATATLDDGGQIELFDITNPGSGYTFTPEVKITPLGNNPYNLDNSKVGLFSDRLTIFQDIDPSSLVVTARVAAVAPFTNQYPVSLGAEISGNTSISSVELGRFAVDNLVVGRRQPDQPIVGAGLISLNGAFSAENTSIKNGITLAGTREILSNGSSGLNFEDLITDAGGTVLITGTGNSTHYLSGVIRDSGLAHGEANIQAEALALINNGSLQGLASVLGGTGYYELPVVTIGAPSSGGTQAAASARIQNGVVVGYDITNPGSGYTATPAVTISEAGPASYNYQGRQRTSGSSSLQPLTVGEVFLDAADFTGQRFYQGIVTQDGNIDLRANSIQQTRVVGFLDTTGFGNYPLSSSFVRLAPLGAGINASGTAATSGGSITGIQLGYGGAGYLQAPTVWIDDPTGSGAAYTAVIDGNGQVTGFTQVSGGTGYTNPTIRIGAPSSTRPVEVIYNQAASSGQYPFTGIEVKDSGGGYLSVPAVTVTGQQVNGVNETGSYSTKAVMMFGSVDLTAAAFNGVDLVGYTTTPTVTIIGGNGINAKATALITYGPTGVGTLTGIRIDDAGGGFTTVPTVSVTGGGRSALDLTSYSYLALQSVTLANVSGYTLTPTVSVAPSSKGTTATAQAVSGTLNFRIGNAAAPGLELVKSASVILGSAEASSITLNTDFTYNYGSYPLAPRTLVLESGGPVSLGISQKPPSPSPIKQTSSIQIPNLSVISGGSISLGTVTGSLSPVHTVRSFSSLIGSGNLDFTTTASPLVIADLSPLGGAMGISGAGAVNLVAPNIQVPVMPNSPQGIYSTIRTGGNVSLSATGILSDPGSISVAVIPQFNSSAYTSSTIRTASDITLTADRIQIGYDGVTIDPGILSTPILSAAGRVILQSETSGLPITIAASTALPNPKTGFGFIPSELANIGASILQIGNASAGAISIQAPVALSTSRLTSAFSLISGSTIGDNGGTSGINYDGGLRLSSVGSISFTGSGNDFGTVAAYSGGNNPITLSSGAFTIGTVDTVTGINAGSSRVTLQPNVAGTAINLGTKSGWSFTDSELDLVTASILQIGRSNAGQITVSAAMTLPSTVPILDLETGAGVADVGGSSGISVTSLAIRAGTGAVSLNGAGNNVSNLAGVISGAAQGFFFTDNSASASDPLTITTVDGQDGLTTNNGDITLTADDMNIVQPVQAGSGVITLQPLTLSTNISLNDPTASLALSTAELLNLSSSSTVVIGNASGTGAISIGGNGSIDLSTETYSFTLRGASSPVLFNGGMTLANGKTFTVNVGTGAVSSPSVGTDITIGGTGVLSIVSAGSVGTLSAPLTTSVAQLSGASVAAASTATSSGLFLSNVTALDVTGAVSVTGNATALGNINLTTSAGGLSNSTGSITSTDGSVTLLGATTVTIGRAVSAATTVTATASGGALVTGAAGTLNAGGNVTGTATTAVTLGGAVNSGGAVSFTATTPLTGTFANTAAITSTLVNTLNPDGSLSPTITLQADTVTLGGTVTAAAGSGGIQLEPLSVGRNIEVFGAAQTVLPGFFIGNTSFGFLGGTAPVTIGRLNGTGEVFVHSSQTVYPTGINRNLTIQAGAQPFSLTPTFTIDGSVTTTGSDLAFNGGGGYFLLDAGTTIDSGAGSISLTGQKVNINGVIDAGSLGSVYNGGTGGAYLNFAGPPVPAVNDLQLFSSGGTGTITTGIFGFGGNGIVYVGDTNVGGASSIGGVSINSQGLSLSTQTRVSLEGNITSVGDPLTVNGNLYLTGDRVISMGGGNLKLLGGVNSLNGLQNLNLNMGTGTLTLAGGTSTDRMGTLTIDQPSTIQFGQALANGQPELGLTMGFTEDFNLTSAVNLDGTLNIALTGYSGANLVLGNFSEATSATAPLSLATVGGGNITTGAVSVSAFTVTSSGAANLNGAVVTTGASSLASGTTLTTQAITASTLNVSAGTSANLRGAVNTSAAGGITVSTPSLITGSSMSAALGNISLAVNSMDLGGNATAQTGNVVLQPFASGNDLNLGTQVPVSSMLQLQAPNGSVTFQTSGAGRIMLTGPINLSSSGTDSYNLVTAGGNVVFSGSSPVLTLPTSGLLSLDLGNGNVISSGGTDYAASQGQLLIVSAGNVTIGTDIPTFGVAGRVSSPASLNLRNVGSLSLVGPIDTGVGNVTIQTLSGDLTLASTIAGGTIQLGAARNFNNQAGSNPFTNRGGGRTLVYSAGQRFDTPYNFAGLNGFGVAFGQGFGSMPGSGNYLVYSSYADVGLANGWQYGSFFAGNSVSALMPYGLFQDVDRLYMPNARSFNLEYILYPDRLEPETLTIPKSVLGNLEDTLGRPPTLQEIQQREVAIREAAMAKKGAIMERSSFDPVIEEKDEEERAEGEKVENSDGGVPQAKVERTQPIRDEAKPVARLPVSVPQAGKSPTRKQGSNGPILRAGPIRSVALLRPAAPSEGSQSGIFSKQAPLLDAKSVIEQERASAEVGIAPPIAAGR